MAVPGRGEAEGERPDSVVDGAPHKAIGAHGGEERVDECHAQQVLRGEMAQDGEHHLRLDVECR